MKQTRTLVVGWLVTCGVALAMITNVSAGDAKERTGKVVRVKGAARYSVGNNGVQPLKVSESLKPGSIIQTAKGASVDISFEEGYATSPSRTAAQPLNPPSRNLNQFLPTTEQDLIRLGEDTVVSVDKL